MTKIAAAYIRRSKVSADSQGDVSREAQMSSIRGLAQAAGIDPDRLVVYEDWGRSADETKRAKRDAFNRLLTDVEEGKVSHVFAYHLDRLVRSSRDFIDLRAITSAAGTTVHAGSMTLTGDDDPMAQAFAEIAATFAGLELGRIKQRNKRVAAVRKARGDDFNASFGTRLERQADGSFRRVDDPVGQRSIQTVIDAFRSAGTVLGAARKLEADGVKAPRGGTVWPTRTVELIIRRADPTILPVRNVRTGRRIAGKARLAQLVKCPFCGKTMTPYRSRGTVYCSDGYRYPDRHPRYTAREADVLAFVQAEADRFRVPDVSIGGQSIEARRAAITDRLARYAELYAEGDIDRAAYDSRKALAQHELDAIAVEEDVAATEVAGRVVDWSADETEVNAFLRSLFIAVELDEQMQPVSVIWRNAEWRQDDAEAVAV